MKAVLYLHKRDRNLLLFSEAPMEYPWLVRLLEDNEKFEPELIATLEPGQRRFIERDLKRLVVQAGTEWQADKGGDPVEVLEGEARKPCALCGAPCKRVCYIVNQLSNLRINVGTECVKHFMDEYKDKTPEQIIQSMRQAYRTARLNALFPDVDWIKAIDDWAKELEDRAVLGPKELEDSYLELRSEARQAVGAYLRNDLGDEDTVRTLASVETRRHALLESIDRYIAEHCDETFVATRAMATWLAEHDPSTLAAVKAAGYVTRETIHKVAEPEFIEKLAPDLSVTLEGVGLRLVQTRPNLGTYIISPLHDPLLRLEIRHRRLLNTQVGTLLLDSQRCPPNQDVVLRNVFDRSSLTSDSVEEAMRRLYALLTTSQLELWDYDNEFDEVYFRDRLANLYVVGPLIAFLEEAKRLLLDRGCSVEQLAAFVRNFKHPRYTVPEFREHDRYRSVVRRVPSLQDVSNR